MAGSCRHSCTIRHVAVMSMTVGSGALPPISSRRPPYPLMGMPILNARCDTLAQSDFMRGWLARA